MGQKLKTRRSVRFAPLGIIFALLGLALFVYFIKRAGLDAILDGIGRLGLGFLLILGTSFIRHVVRALAWVNCFEAPYRLRFRDALQARLMGDALGNIIPLASVAVSEPSKAVFVRDRVPLVVGLAALALENIFYSLSVILVIFSGTTALLLSFTLPKSLRYVAIGALVVSALMVPLGYFVIRRKWRFLSGSVFFLRNRGIAAARMERVAPRAQTLEDRIYGFYQNNRRKLLPIMLLEICFHMAGVAEIYTTLSFISETVAPTLLTAFILESVNRVINVAFKFIPFRLGVDEGGTGRVSKVLGLTEPVGITLAVVRKGRDLFWTSVGMVLILRKGLSLRSVTTQTEELAAEETVSNGAA